MVEQGKGHGSSCMMLGMCVHASGAHLRSLQGLNVSREVGICLTRAAKRQMDLLWVIWPHSLRAPIRAQS